MAREAAALKKLEKKLEEQLCCAICLNFYIEPKVLQCLHIFCKGCLLKLVDRNHKEVTCPICRLETPVPSGGITSLQTAFQVNELLEIRKDFMKENTSIVSKEFIEENSSSSKEFLATCLEHNGRELELYCKKCEELACLKCVSMGENHYGHSYTTLKEGFNRYKIEVSPLVETMKISLQTFTDALKQINSCRDEIVDQQVTIEGNIHDSFRKIQEVLNARKTKLISHLYQITQRKLEALEDQKDKIETAKEQLNNSLELVSKSLETDKREETMKMKATIMNQVKKTSTSVQVDLFLPHAHADMEFSASPYIHKIGKNYGNVYATKEPHPSKCYAVGRCLEELTELDEKLLLEMQVLTFEGTPYNEPIRSLKCELVSEITGAVVRGNVESRVLNEYTISCLPSIKGRHQLHVKIDDQHIRGSPFPIKVGLLLENLGTSIRTTGGLKGPFGIAVNEKNSEVVVVEYCLNCVSVFSCHGDKILSFGTTGSKNGEFQHPQGVAVDGEGNILVVDGFNHRVQKFTASGEFLAAMSSEDSSSFRLNFPHDITFNTFNNKIYLVSKDSSVHVLNSDLTHSSTFGKQGNGKGEFNSPFGIACDISGNVYVVDTNNHRIQVFTADGEFLRMFGDRGVGKGELNLPMGIAIDTNGTVYITEGDNHRVSVFTTDGQFKTSFGVKGRSSGEFLQPRGIAVDECGVVYVCEKGNGRIQLF